MRLNIRQYEATQNTSGSFFDVNVTKSKHSLLVQIVFISVACSRSELRTQIRYLQSLSFSYTLSIFPGENRKSLLILGMPNWVELLVTASVDLSWKGQLASIHCRALPPCVALHRQFLTCNVRRVLPTQYRCFFVLNYVELSFFAGP